MFVIDKDHVPDFVQRRSPRQSRVSYDNPYGTLIVFPGR